MCIRAFVFKIVYIRRVHTCVYVSVFLCVYTRAFVSRLCRYEGYTRACMCLFFCVYIRRGIFIKSWEKCRYAHVCLFIRVYICLFIRRRLFRCKAVHMCVCLFLRHIRIHIFASALAHYIFASALAQVHIHLDAYIHEYTHMRLYSSLYKRIGIPIIMYICLYICIPIIMYVCLYICIPTIMYVCVYRAYP
jgi:hypothetical protein